MNKSQNMNDSHKATPRRLLTTVFSVILVGALCFTDTLSASAAAASESAVPGSATTSASPSSDAPISASSESTAVPSSSVSGVASSSDTSVSSEPASGTSSSSVSSASQDEPTADNPDASSAAGEEIQAPFGAPPAAPLGAGLSPEDAALLNIKVEGIRLGSTTSTVNAPYDAKSGENVYTQVSFSASGGGSVAQSGIPAGSIYFRVRLPKGAEVKMAPNDDILSYEGDADAPGGAGSDPDYTYVWIAWNTAFHSGAATSFSMMVTPFAAGVTAHGAACDLQVQPYVLDSQGTMRLCSGGEAGNAYNAVTDIFAWKNPAYSASSTSYTNTTGANDVGTLSLTVQTGPDYAAADTGVAYAKQISFSNSYALPLDAGGAPYILLPYVEGVFRTSASASSSTNKLVENSDYTVDAFVELDLNHDGINEKYITKFTLIKTIQNQKTTADLCAPGAFLSYTAYLVGATYNHTAILAEGTGDELAAGQTREFSLTLLAAANTATPVCAVAATGTSAISIDAASLPAFAVNFSYTYTKGDGSESTGNLSFVKEILSIGTQSTAGTDNSALAAFPGDVVEYRLRPNTSSDTTSANFINRQNESIDKLVIEDKITTGAGDWGYRPEEMLPFKIETGAYLRGTVQDAVMSYAVLISYGTNGSLEIPITDPSQNQTIDLTAYASTFALHEITSIQFIFKNIEPGFQIGISGGCAAPQIYYVVQEAADNDMMHGEIIDNTASFQYEYQSAKVNNYTSPLFKDNAYFTYKYYPDNIEGKYRFNKTAENLNTKNGSWPAEGDVLLFTIDIRNDTALPAELGQLTDSYSSNLAVYNGTQVTVSGSNPTAISSDYLDAANLSNVVLWDKNGNRVDNAIESVTDTNGVMTIHFADGITLAAGTAVRVTYTMCVTQQIGTNTIISNRFEIFTKQNTRLGEGKFIWARGGTYLRSRKEWKNITPGAFATSAPQPDDILQFSITAQNTSQDVWAAPIVITDEYTSDLIEPYETDQLVIAALLYRDKTSGGVSQSLVAYTRSELEQIYGDTFTVTWNHNAGAAQSSFTIALPAGMSLSPGESLTLDYTMKVRSTVKGGDTIINLFYVGSNGRTVSEGYCSITVDEYAESVGLVSVVKSTVGIESATGTTPVINALLHGDKTSFDIEASNHHTRQNREMHIKNITDTLADYVTLDTGSIVVEKRTLQRNAADTGYEIVAVALDPLLDYTIEYTYAIPGDTTSRITGFTVRLTSAYTLASSLLASSEPVHRLGVRYEAVIDTTDWTGSASSLTQTPAAYAYLTDEPAFLQIKQGLAGQIADAADLDNDASTRSRVGSQVSMTIYSSTNYNVSLAKKVDNSALTVPGTNLTRTYTVRVENFSIPALSLDTIVDLLPHYETLDGDIQMRILPEGVDPATVSETYTVRYTAGTNPTSTNYGTQRLIMTGYMNGATPVDGFMVPGGKLNTSTAKFTCSALEFTYTTKIDGAAAHAYFEATTATVFSITPSNYVAIYPSKNAFGGETYLTRYPGGSGSLSTGTNDDKTSSDWDNDPSTARRYYTFTMVTLTSASAAPYVDISGRLAYTSPGSSTETYTGYNQSNVNADVNPTDIVAWNVTFGNSRYYNGSNSVFGTLQAGAKLVVVLPKGLTYEGQDRAAASLTTAPWSFFVDETPTQQALADGRTVLVWEMGTAMAPGEKAEILFRTSTAADLYTTYKPEAYLIPADGDQHFLDSIVRLSREYKGSYNFSLGSGDLSAWGIGTPAGVRYVVSRCAMDVFGRLGVSSQIIVESGGAQRSSNDSDRVLPLTDREDDLTYTLRVDVTDTASHGLKNGVLINRLPAAGDSNVSDSGSRNSEAGVRLTQNSTFAVGVASIAGGSPLPISGADYELEFRLNGAADETFTDDDWANRADARWTAQSAMQSGDWEKVTAIRVRFIAGYEIPKGYRLTVVYTAKLFDYFYGELVAHNSMAYSGSINDVSLQGIEPLAVGVRAPVLYDRVSVTKILNDTANPLRQTSFDMELVVYQNGNEVDVRPFSIDTTTSTATGWKGEYLFTDLAQGYTYSVREATPAGFRAPQITSSKTTHADGTYTWNFTVTNNPIKYTLQYSANGGAGTQTDTASPYYMDATVKVLGQGGITYQGHDFLGWNTAADGSGAWYYPGTTFVLTRNTILYAQWQPASSSSSSSSSASSGSSSSGGGGGGGGTSSTSSSTPAGTASSSGTTAASSSGTPSGSASSPITSGSGSTPTASVPIPGPPLAPPASAWALLNLILTILGLVGAVVLIFSLFARQKNEDEEEGDTAGSDENPPQNRLRILWCVLAAATAVISLIVFLLTEDMTLPMIFVDRWTLLMVVFAVIEGIFAVMMKKHKSEDAEQDDTPPQTA